jgi:hypothetical protein
VNSHHVGEGDTRVLVFFSDSAARVEEETVTELHIVGLVDGGNVLESKDRTRASVQPKIGWSVA